MTAGLPYLLADSRGEELLKMEMSLQLRSLWPHLALGLFVSGRRGWLCPGQDKRELDGCQLTSGGD